MASRDAHIVFSPTESPNWTRDNVYEIRKKTQSHRLRLVNCYWQFSVIASMFYVTVVGGWGNERTLIRRKRQDNDMTVEYTSNVLQRDNVLQLLIEITTGMCVLFCFVLVLILL